MDSDSFSLNVNVFSSSDLIKTAAAAHMVLNATKSTI